MGKRRPILRRWATVAGTVLVLGGGASVWVATRPSGPVYRLAAAGPADVASTLSTTGTIQSINQSTLSFPVSGQVASVNVQVGQQVSAGEVVASLDTTSLSTQVTAAQSRAASAQAKLATDQNSQTAAATAAPAQQPTTAKPSGDTRAAPPPALASGQAAVKKAQQQVDGDLATAGAAANREKATCSQAIDSMNASATSTESSPTSSASPDSTPTTSADSPPSSSGSTGSEEVSQCTALIQQVLNDQSRTSGDEAALANAEAGLTTTLNQAAASVNQAASTLSSAGRSSVPSAPSGDRAAPPSADQLAADQASVDATNADLLAAQQNLGAASLTSPIAGTVAQVGLIAGQSVAGGSTQSDIVIIGPGADEVTTTASDVQLGQIHPGERATVTPDGTNLRLTGQVASVGILPSATLSGGVSYPVTISLDQTSQQLFAGATTTVSITVGSARAPITVPTSAVHTEGSRHVVSVLRDGRVTVTPVTLGVVGSTTTQVVSGLHSGDNVVLANLDAPLPTTNSNTRGLGGGGFGGSPGGGGAGRAGGGGRGG
jgi:multidrug efflux pump subunit AcrA (membrane-fusion protein)